MGKIISYDNGRYERKLYYMQGIENTIVSFIEPERAFQIGTDIRKYELLGYGVHGAESQAPICITILHFFMTQCILGNRCRNLNQIYCESFYIAANEIMNVDVQTLIGIACECALKYHVKGYQVLYSVYRDENGNVLIHFLINPVSYQGYSPWHTTLRELELREELFNQILTIYITSKRIVSLNNNNDHNV